MRDFFIGALDKLIAVVAVLMCIGVVIVAGMVATGAGGPGQPGGILPALFVLVAGAIYVIFVVGFMYLGLGIYQNTKRTAAALEARN